MQQNAPAGRGCRRVRYRMARRPGTWLAAGLMALSAARRLFWRARWPEAAGGRDAALVLLPVLSCLLYAACILLWGRQRLWCSFFPAAGGVLFFLLKAETFAWWHRLLCTALYLAVALLYGLTVFGLPIRRLLIPLFGLPLAFHLLVEDLLLAGPGYTAAQWVQELSVLAIMAALLAAARTMEANPPPGRRPRLL